MANQVTTKTTSKPEIVTQSSHSRASPQSYDPQGNLVSPNTETRALGEGLANSGKEILISAKDSTGECIKRVASGVTSTANGIDDNFQALKAGNTNKQLSFWGFNAASLGFGLWGLSSGINLVKDFFSPQVTKVATLWKGLETALSLTMAGGIFSAVNKTNGSKFKSIKSLLPGVIGLLGLRGLSSYSQNKSGIFGAVAHMIPGGSKSLDTISSIGSSSKVPVQQTTSPEV